MQKLVRLVATVILFLGTVFFGVQSQADALTLPHVTLSSSPVLAETDLTGRRNPADEVLQTTYGTKLDLNNANVRLFRNLRGFYPNLAQKIVDNAPYDKVEDVLNIPGLSDKQKDRLQANLDNFTVNPPSSVFLEGDERLNNGNY